MTNVGKIMTGSGLVMVVGGAVVLVGTATLGEHSWASSSDKDKLYGVGGGFGDHRRSAK
jgi:hypothetical protein